MQSIDIAEATASSAWSIATHTWNRAKMKWRCADVTDRTTLNIQLTGFMRQFAWHLHTC